MAATAFRYLSQEDVVAAGGLDMAAIVDVIERAFRVKAEGQVFMPPKVMITWCDEPGTEEKHGRIMRRSRALDALAGQWLLRAV